MKATGLLALPNVKVTEPREATCEELLLFHEQDYVKHVREMSQSGEGLLDMGDTPAFKGCYEASALATGASLAACDLAMSGEITHAMNMSGGLHHAHPDRASGFCIFNDPAVAIAYLKKKYALERILYLDIDAHHGDGVMYGFYSDPTLLDIDFHEDGHYLFPGTGATGETGEGKGAGLKINVPLMPMTDDETYLRLFREIVPTAVRKYRPQILLLQCGADSHVNDLLAQLQLTTRAYREVVATLHELSHEVADGRLVVFGGGGYNIANVARIWAVAAATLIGFRYPDRTPESWRRLFEALIGEEAPSSVNSDHEVKSRLTQDIVLEHANATIRDLKERVSLLV